MWSNLWYYTPVRVCCYTPRATWKTNSKRKEKLSGRLLDNDLQTKDAGFTQESPCSGHKNKTTEILRSHQQTITDQTHQQNTQIRPGTQSHYTLDVAKTISKSKNRFSRRSRQKHIQTRSMQEGSFVRESSAQSLLLRPNWTEERKRVFSERMREVWKNRKNK